MAGLVKSPKYDWKDSNLALFGSDLEKNVKKAAAEQEASWEGAGSQVGKKIWRINNFKVEDWPKSDYGKFFDGDSYIILNTYKEQDELKYDLHFWIGTYSTADEYGTAAYKTVELDTFLDDKPVQHREVMSYESDLFKSYFPKIDILKGGTASGFKSVADRIKKHEPRLLHFHGSSAGNITVKEISLNKGNLDPADVYILDVYDKIYLWNGPQCDKDEKFAARQYIQTLKSERNGKPRDEVMDGPEDEDDEFRSYFKDDEVMETKDEFKVSDSKKMFKLSDETGNLVFSEVDYSRNNLGTNDVFIVDDTKHCFVWVGKGASSAEKKMGFPYAHQYLQTKGGDNPTLPVSIVREGKEGARFASCF